jgi:hypothetical protein
MPTRTTAALCFVEYDSTNNVLRLIPVNNLGDDKLEAAFTDMGAMTTVAAAQEDAGRAGYGQSSGPYNVLKLTFS